MAALNSTRPRRSATTRRSDAAAWQAYRHQSAPSQRLFGLLRTLPGTHHGVAGLAAAMALSETEVTSMLRGLADSGLLVPAGTGRWAVSERGRALRPEWAAVDGRSIQRWYDWYLAHVAAAAELLYPQALRLEPQPSSTIPTITVTTSPTAQDWLDEEIDNLHAAILGAAGVGAPRFAWLLADGLRGYAWHRPTVVDWVATGAAAVSAARVAGGPRVCAAAYLCLAEAHFLAGHLDRADEACAALGAQASRAGWLSGYAASFANRGGIAHRRGHLDDALDAYQQALDLYAAAGRPSNQATLHNHIGQIQLARAEAHQAVLSHRRALVIFRQAGSLTGEARTLEALAHACRAAGQDKAAERVLVQAFLVYGRLGDRVGEARARSLAARIAAPVRNAPAA